jgi:pimeloyl-ACP methyl ester carboxylesterase
MGTSITNAGAPSPLRVNRHGAGEPRIAVLHGGPGAPGSAVTLARSLAAFGGVLEPWQRRAGAMPLTVERHVADLAAVLPWPCVLVGWSWGAMLALSFATARPELATSLVLVGCGTYDQASRRAYQRAMADRLGSAGQVRMAALAAELERAADRPLRDRILAELGRMASEAQAYDPIGPTDVAELDADGYAETWADVLRLQRAGVEPSSFAAIDRPVLMIHGADDPHPGPSTRDVLGRHLPQLEYVEIARCGHEPWRERSGREPFLAAVRAWLERVAGPSDVRPGRP